jgi:hypothetical protein
MKNAFLLLTMGLFFTACATPKYVAFNPTKAEMASKRIEGKIPKEASNLLGKPMSAYYHKDGSSYHLIYPISDKEVSMTDLMFNKDLECLSFNFEKDKKFKYDGWKVLAFNCSTIKDEKLDTSLID